MSTYFSNKPLYTIVMLFFERLNSLKILKACHWNIDAVNPRGKHVLM